MLALVRASLTAALVILSSISAFSADKPYHRDDLAEAAVRLEGQIKADAGTVAKPLATLRRDADAAFARNDQKGGMRALGQIIAVAPADSANWLRLARAVLQITPADDRERATLLERAATAAYIAYQRTTDPGQEAAALVVLGRSYSDRTLWRPALDALRLSLELREVAMCARNMKSCATITASGSWTTRSIRIPPRRACASSFPSNCRASASTSRPSCPSPARTSRRFPPTKSSSASRV
jgi:alpha-2-macroglobulin